MRMRWIYTAMGWTVAVGLLAAMGTLRTGAADPAGRQHPAPPAANTPSAPATIELDVPVVEPPAPLRHGVSKTGRQHNSNCRYWKTVVAPVDPAKAPIRCKICGG